ncbi:hypothetical protein BC834DRAFT_1035432 [Gloeopeniophorella convolvens]|nr:hypothetical protein BC834DRAFT_1035432 [Gloeopeniophorella convolvens]
MSQTFKFLEHPSPQVKIAQQYLKSLSEWNFEQLSKFTTDEFTQTSLPASLGIPVRSKAEDLEYVKELKDRLEGNPLEITIYAVNEDKNSVWIHTFVHGSASSGTPLNIEAIYLFTFEKSGPQQKIEGIKEFADSDALIKFGSGSASGPQALGA